MALFFGRMGVVIVAGIWVWGLQHPAWHGLVVTRFARWWLRSSTMSHVTWGEGWCLSMVDRLFGTGISVEMRFDLFSTLDRVFVGYTIMSMQPNSTSIWAYTICRLYRTFWTLYNNLHFQMGSYMYPPCEFLTHNHHLLPLIPILSLSQACPALWKSNSHISRHVDVKNANMNSWALEWSCPWSEKDDTSPKAVMTKPWHHHVHSIYRCKHCFNHDEHQLIDGLSDAVRCHCAWSDVISQWHGYITGLCKHNTPQVESESHSYILEFRGSTSFHQVNLLLQPPSSRVQSWCWTTCLLLSTCHSSVILLSAPLFLCE